jgi:predicted small lipoprotein YifL
LLALVVAVLAALGGCGQTGPLRLPEGSSAASTGGGAADEDEDERDDRDATADER